MSDQNDQWPADPAANQAPQTAPPLVEPTEWLAWDELEGREEPVVLAEVEPNPSTGASETLADLRPEGVPENGVHALRAILLGSDSRDNGARLEAIERRLDERDASLRTLEQRLERLAERIEEARDAARGADVTLDSLTALQRQMDELRRGQTHLAADIAERARDADERCRLRQRQVRTASQLEMQRLRRRLYSHDRDAEPWAPPGRVAPRGATMSAPAAQPVQTAHPLANDPNAGLPGWDLREGQWMPAGTVTPPAYEPDALDDSGDGDFLDASTAWRAVRRSIATLLRALLAWFVVLAHLAVDDMRAGAQRIGELFRW
jgi:hypothetical protein